MLSESIHLTLMSIVTAVSAGVMLLVISRRFNIPGIVLLLLGGIALGPLGLGLVVPESLGDGLRVMASLGVGLILFEGGLTLDVRGYFSASQVIKRLLSIGVLTTWFATTLAIVFIFGGELSTALIAASLVIVTGPTVIGPLLRRVRVTPRLHSILHWEGVLIDPIGVFVALLCFEWIATHSGPTAIGNFALRVVLGFGIGLIGGWLIYFAERKKFVPDDMINVFAFASAVLIFGLSEAAVTESGLLAVTVAGFVLGVMQPVRLEQIRIFKAEITDLLIGTLFILLAARLSFGQFENFGMRGALVVAAVLFVVRPLNIFVCTFGLQLDWREKLFLSWVAPRGIVAASMASLFSLSGMVPGPYPRFIETFVYSVIVATIILQGFTAGWLARCLGLHNPERRGWLIVGAHPLGRELARFISGRTGAQTILLDTNSMAIAEAQQEGLDAVVGDARNPDAQNLEEVVELFSVGNVLALTDNEDLNTLVCQSWGSRVGSDRVYRWGRITTKSIDQDKGSGVLVWSDLPKPSLIADALVQGAISLYESNTYEDDGEDMRTPIVALREDEVVLDPPSHGVDTTGLTQTLYLKQEIEMYDSDLT
ncbi:MAG: sodium:proton antiporter [Bdellovibrionales bacterium]|nr:sodium:proton antiporter [Bdellovibrionales bacterium]